MTPTPPTQMTPSFANRLRLAEEEAQRIVGSVTSRFSYDTPVGAIAFHASMTNAIAAALRARAAPPADGEVDTIVAAANVTIATFRTHLSEANAALAIERAAGDELEHSVDEWRERATVAETRLRLAEEVAEHLQDCADKLEELGASGYAESARVALAAYTASVKKGDGM